MDFYLIAKALHVISVISWMAGMLYLPRLYVYHADTDVGSQQSETFKIMERRLLRAIMTPAMIASFAFGIWIIFLNPGVTEGWWFHAKMLAVLTMAAIHGLLAQHRKQFEQDLREKSARYFRFLNEAPTILMILIVFLVFLQPS